MGVPAAAAAPGGDLFPLPCAEPSPPSYVSSRSKRVRGRAGRREFLRSVNTETNAALNSLYGPVGGDTPAEPSLEPSSHRMLDRAKALCHSRRDEPTGGAALGALLKCSNVIMDYSKTKKTKPTYLTLRDVDRIAEPSDNERVRMDEACSSAFLSDLRDALRFVLPGTRARKGRVYGSPQAYRKYIAGAIPAELVGLCKARDVKVVNNLFFLEKFGKGTLRKIIDCRPSNPYMGEAGPTELAGPWHSTEFSAGGFWAAEGDVESAFTRVETIREMWAYQCLPAVRAGGVLSESAFEGGTYRCPFTGSVFYPGEECFPCYIRLPMGGVRSAEIMQHIGMRILEEALPEVPHFCRPVHDSKRIDLADAPAGVAWGLYLDNFYVVGLTREATADVLLTGLAALERAGLKCIVTQPPSRDAKILGFAFDGRAATVGVPAERMRLLRNAGLWLADQECIHVDVLERVLGHFTWAFLVQRPLYSIFHAMYLFISQNRGRYVPLWASVRKELQLASRLVHLAVHELDRGVAPVLFCSDAEGMSNQDMGGGGVVSRILEPSEAASFRDSSAWETEPGTEPAAPLVEACQEEVWIEHVHRRWRYPAHNNSLEFEAVLLAAKCVARVPALRGKYIPFLTDSSVVLGCMRKGRSSSYGLCCKARKLAALSLAYGVHLFPRWVPTHLCPADSVSRRKQDPL